MNVRFVPPLPLKETMMILWHPLNKFPYTNLGNGKIIHERYFYPNLINECCEGCERASHGHCKVYSNTILMWERGNCPMATHVHHKAEQKQKVNPLKASKKSKKRVR